MKKFLFAALLVATMITTAFADENKVSSKIINNFKSDFTEAKNPTWTASRDFSSSPVPARTWDLSLLTRPQPAKVP